MISAIRGATGLLLTCLLPLSACNPARPSAAGPAPSPIISTAEAADVLAAYDVANNKINEAADAAALAEIEAAPLRFSSKAELTVSKVLDRPIPLIMSADPRFLIPSAAGGPRRFLSTSTRLRGGVVATNQTYIVFQQLDGTSPWLATYSLTPPGGMAVPTVALNGVSAATEVTDFGNLARPPAELAQRIFEHYSQDLSGKDDFGPSAVLDDQLGNGYKVASQVLRGRNTRLTRTVVPKAPQVFALRTEDGGALVFSTSTVVDVLAPLHGSGTVSLTPGGNEAALFGTAGGATASRFTITRQQNFLTHIPTKASGEPVDVLAYTDFPITVCWQPDNNKRSTKCSA